jgi:hypothetical protein
MFAGGLAALALAGCGTSAKPLAGTVNPNGKPIGRGRVDDPRTNKPNHVACLRKQHLQVTLVGQTGIQIGTPPAGPRVVFEPTAGIAQGMQIQGQAQPAEVIGSALVYPDQGSDSELKKVEDCIAEGVSG